MGVILTHWFSGHLVLLYGVQPAVEHMIIDNREKKKTAKI
jgi:hypothetical protein